jgi:hypothetical protein
VEPARARHNVIAVSEATEAGYVRHHERGSTVVEQCHPPPGSTPQAPPKRHQTPHGSATS